MKEEAIRTIDDLRKNYRQKLINRVYAMDALWLHYKRNKNSEVLDKFYLLVHNLSGTAGTYGYPYVGQLCRALALYLENCNEEKSEPSDQTISHRLETLIVLSCLETCESIYDADKDKMPVSTARPDRCRERDTVAPTI